MHYAFSIRIIMHYAFSIRIIMHYAFSIISGEIYCHLVKNLTYWL